MTLQYSIITLKFKKVSHHCVITQILKFQTWLVVAAK